jgi:glycosyltransferase involved in cell wall biosynthesis
MLDAEESVRSSDTMPAGETAPRYSIVVPVHNEAECLAEEVGGLVGKMDARGVDYELLLAENGSSDDTPVISEKLAAANPRIRALRVPVPDYGAAMKTGMLTARGDLIVNFDIDFHDVDFMLKAGDVLEGFDGAGIVVGREPKIVARPRGTSCPSGSRPF